MSPLKGVFCSQDAEINARLQALHLRLTSDPRVQIAIDTYLPCCALARQGVPVTFPLMRYRLLPDDAPQFGNLPDLGNQLRICIQQIILSQTETGTLFTSITVSIFRSMPKDSRSFTKHTARVASVSIILNLLLAMLLGLYPSCVRRPAWEARVNIYTRIHSLLTSPPEAQFQFVLKHMTLVKMAICEYLCRTTTECLPGEAEYIGAWLRTGALPPTFIQTKLDSFRQDHIDDGNESWSTWTDVLQPCLETLVRGARKYTKPRRPTRDAPSVLEAQRDIKTSLRFPCLTSYPIHTHMPEKLIAEYNTLLGHTTTSIHEHVSIGYLPAAVTQFQMKRLGILAQQCEHRAAMRRTKHICLLCVLLGYPQQIRLHIPSWDCVHSTDQPLKMTCSRHDASHLVAVDMIGKVLRCGNTRYIFAPCCTTVQIYKGDSDQLWRTTATGLPNCSCTHVDTTPSQTCKVQHCFICPTRTGLTSITNVLDHKAISFTTVSICQRHMPPPDLVKYASNLQDLAAVCTSWEASQRHKRPRRLI